MLFLLVKDKKQEGEILLFSYSVVVIGIIINLSNFMLKLKCCVFIALLILHCTSRYKSVQSCLTFSRAKHARISLLAQVRVVMNIV